MKVVPFSWSARTALVDLFNLVPLVLFVRYAADSKLKKTAPESGCIRCKTGALYQSFGHLPTMSQRIDTMPRSILLFCVSGKSAIQGICPIGVFKILCTAGFFCVVGFVRRSRSKEQFEYPKSTECCSVQSARQAVHCGKTQLRNESQVIKFDYPIL